MDRIDIAFLVTGIVIIVVVGRLLTLTGRRYVGGAGGAGRNVGSVATLLSTVFHLVTLGVVALVSVLPVGKGVPGFTVRIGILLLLLGAIYGAFVGALARRREVAVTEAAVTEPSDAAAGEDLMTKNPNVPSNAPSYLPPTGLPGNDT